MKETEALIPMTLAFYVPPQCNGDEQAVCITGMNLYVQELIATFKNNITDIKTEILPVVAYTEKPEKQSYKAEQVIAYYEYSYNCLIKFNAAASEFQAIHDWYLKQLKESEIYWISNTAEDCLKDWTESLQE